MSVANCDFNFKERITAIRKTKTDDINIFLLMISEKLKKESLNNTEYEFKMLSFLCDTFI
jgi:hypothetical protein